MLLNILRWVKTQRDKLYFFFGVRDRLKWPSPLSLSLSLSDSSHSLLFLSPSQILIAHNKMASLVACSPAGLYIYLITQGKWVWIFGVVTIEQGEGPDRAPVRRREGPTGEMRSNQLYNISIERAEWVSAVLEGQYNNRNRAEW